MMHKIEKHNCEGLCQETFCSNPEMFFEEVEINGLKIHISLCKEHAAKWDKTVWRRDTDAFLEEPQFQKIHSLGCEETV